MSFSEALFLVITPWIVVVFLVVAMTKLAAEIREIRIQLSRPLEPISFRPKDKAIVHDHHSDDEEYQSVTARAQKAWG